MTSSDLYIWIYLSDRLQPVVAGMLELERTAAKTVGRFVYGKSYLARPNAEPVDPVTLPLGRQSEFSTLLGYPGVIMDSCPDKWGIKVIDRI